MNPRSITPNETGRKRGWLKHFLDDLGPGLITGAADDDPSGISTYSMAGAVYGYGLLWTALLTFPLMVSVQSMCGRLGLVTGHGLAEVIRRNYSKWILWGACALLLVANVFNLAADLNGMAEATELLTGVPSAIWTPLYAAVIVGFLFFSSYRQIARIFKWTTLVLLAYIITAFFAKVDWRHALIATVVPHPVWSRDYVAMFVALLGTTITPCLFFWQSSQEVEDQRAQGKNPAKRIGASRSELRRLRVDVWTGMFASNLVMYFIILTTAATLHAHGIVKIETARDAAEALRPFAGSAAYLLFTLGLVGTGMLGVPVFAATCAYTVAEAAGWRGSSLQQQPGRARNFYFVIAGAMVIGLALDCVGWKAVQMLFWAAVLNGVLAPPLILLIVLLTSNSRVMGNRVNSRLQRLLGLVTFFVMATAALCLFLT